MLKLREIRLAKKVSIAELSRLSGVSKRTIEDLESRGDCRISTARTLCDALGVTLDEAWPSEDKQQIILPIIFEAEEDDKGYTVHVPALEGCFTQGDTFNEALRMICDAIHLYMDDDPQLPMATK